MAECEICLQNSCPEECACLAEALVNRAVQLRRLNKMRAAAVNEIKLVQVKQKAVQNKHHRIRDDYLPVGTKVYITVEGIKNKLYPKYRGPFTIVERTENDTYIVENLLRERLRGTFPLQRMKVIARDHPEINDNFNRVKKLVDFKRDENGKNFYLVEWQNEKGPKEFTW